MTCLGLQFLAVAKLLFSTFLNVIAVRVDSCLFVRMNCHCKLHNCMSGVGGVYGESVTALSA